jgi:hypothetical protein
MWKEAVVAYLKALSRHFPGQTEGKQEKLIQDSRSPGHDLKPGAPKYEKGVLTTEPRRSVEEQSLLN